MILVEAFKGKPVTEQSVETVERKGKGLLDYPTDGHDRACGRYSGHFRHLDGKPRSHGRTFQGKRGRRSADSRET